MYLILSPVTTLSCQVNLEGPFTPYFTRDIQRVAQAIENDHNVVVYRIDNMTQIKEIEITYNEIVMEE